MTWRPTYVDLEVAKANLRIDADDETDDLFIEIVIEAASRAIDQATNRQFGNLSPAAARYYDGLKTAPPSRLWPTVTAQGPWGDRQAVEVDDLMTTTDLAVAFDRDADGTFEDVITDYDLWPWNAEADGRPWTHLVFRPTVSVPVGQRAVQVTAEWGWLDVPQLVVQACLMQTNRWVKRREAPFGVAGSPDLGSELRLLAKLDPDVAVAVGVLKRPWAAA